MSFILVYVDYDRLSILDIGNKEEIIKSYVEYCNKIDDFKKMFGEKWYMSFEEDFSSIEEYEKFMDAVSESDVNNFDSKDRLCIMGKVEGKVACVCKEFKVGSGKLILY